MDKVRLALPLIYLDQCTRSITSCFRRLFLPHNLRIPAKAPRHENMHTNSDSLWIILLSKLLPQSLPELRVPNPPLARLSRKPLPQNERPHQLHPSSHLLSTFWIPVSTYARYPRGRVWIWL